MAVNKVVLRGETLIDLTEDTVKPETLALGATAHDASGNQIVGEMEAGEVAKDVEKYVVVGVWGQSNAVGYDEGVVNIFDQPMYSNNRIMQISAVDNQLKPLTYCAENLQNMNTVIPQGYTGSNMAGQPKPQQGTKGIHLPLANLICDAIPDEYGVIIVPYAYGGQGISYFRNEARVSGFTNNIKKAMDLNEANVFAGIIWCQGENDSNSMNKAAYKTAFEALVADVNGRLQDYVDRTSGKAINAKTWYFYEYPVSYRNNTYGYEIMEAIKEVVGTRNYIALREDHPVNITKYTSSNMAAHYAGDFYRTDVAPKVFMAMNNNGAFFRNLHDSDTIGGSSTETAQLSTKIANLEKKNTALEAELAAFREALENLGADIPETGPVLRVLTQDDIKKGVKSGTDFNPIVSDGTLTVQGAGGAGVNMFSEDITHFEGTTNGKNFTFIVAGNDTTGHGMFAQQVGSNNYYYGKAEGQAGFSAKSISGYTSASNLASQRFVMDIDGNNVTAKLGEQVIFQGDVTVGLGGDMTFTTPRLGIGVSWSGSIGNFVFTDCKVY